MPNKFFYILQKGVTTINYALIAVQSKFFYIKSQKGVTMIEYALIAALVAVVAIATLTVVGTNLNLVFNKVSNKLR